jgi:uncharacterized protein YchJ
MTHTFTRPARAAAAALSALVLAACATVSGTPEEQVAQLAQQRWDALIKRDFDAAYDYAQPGFRAAVPRESYKNRFGSAGQWKAAQIHSVTCEAERCIARIYLTTAVMVPTFARDIPETSTYFNETWVRDEGRWWYVEAL